MSTTLHNDLQTFLAMPTIAHDETTNAQALAYLQERLEALHFEVHLAGDSPYKQPVLLAEYESTRSTRKVVLYSHYDVEQIRHPEQWKTPPFELVEKDGRYYARGIADNKGILLARLYAIQALQGKDAPLPNILWVIQGEEEVAGPTPFTVFPEVFASYGAPLYVEETGVHQEDIPVLFHLPQRSEPPAVLHALNNHLYSGKARYANRSLSKFTTCPFLESLPAGSQYIGFGPNDKWCNIHQPNESLSRVALEEHQGIFEQFLEWVALEGPL